MHVVYNNEPNNVRLCEEIEKVDGKIYENILLYSPIIIINCMFILTWHPRMVCTVQINVHYVYKYMHLIE